MVALGPPGPWHVAGDDAAPFAIEVVPPATSPPMASSLRVVTFNVEYRSRTDALIGALRDHVDLRRADVFLLQEVEPHPVDGARAPRLADALGMGHAYAHGVAIMCRWPLRDVALMELPHAHVPYHQRRRIALRADLDTDAGRLRLTTIHLDTRLDGDVRLRQLAPAVDDHPRQILGGDMNTLPFRFAAGAVPILPADQARRLDDTMRRRGFDTPVRDAGATHRSLWKVRLDALFTRGFAPSRAHVARDVRVSDHFPVWADLAWSQPTPR